MTPNTIDRRRFLEFAAAAAAASTTRLLAQKPAPTGSFAVKPTSFGVMPLDFAGLSYESSQLADPTFFSPANKPLIALFKSLNPSGVLRTGGNLSAFTVWHDDPAAPVTPAEQAILDRGKKYWEWKLSSPPAAKGAHETVLSPASIEPLAGFLKATGWKLIYGLNFATGTPEQAAAEAACVQKFAGSSLLAFQLGNEIDFWRGGFRGPDWDFDHMFAQWSEWIKVIRAKAPDAPFAGPDTAVNLDWVQRLSGTHNASKLAFVSAHHYAMGPGPTPKAGADHLLGPDDEIPKEIAAAQHAKDVAGLGFRNTECNSCFHGGQPGVSDAYVSALWSADYMLRLAKAGHAGVNLHGGGDGIYTPISGDPETGALSPRPLFFGMRFAQAFAGATLLETALSTGGANLTSYAGQRRGELLVALINKDANPVHIRIDRKSMGGANLRAIAQLSGPSLDAHTGVAFEYLKLPPAELAARADGLDVPPYTALLLRFSA
jgi:hypothetical protein